MTGTNTQVAPGILRGPGQLTLRPAHSPNLDERSELMAERNCSVPGCVAVHYGRGFCRLHYDRWKRHGDPLRGPLSEDERFWAKVDRRGPDECWQWTGAVNARGYGNFGTGDRANKKGHRAHRFAYELAVGPIPDGLVIDHTCHSYSDCAEGEDCPHRRCVNPRHLEAVTVAENQRRGHHSAARARRWPTITHCPHGHPYDAENTYFVKGTTVRMCRECQRRRMRERYWRKKAQP